MYAVVRCCRCNEPVRLPHSENATWVRCPHCNADYPIDRVLADLPPMLEAVPQPSLAAIPIGGDETDAVSTKDSETNSAPSKNTEATIVDLNESPLASSGAVLMESQAPVVNPSTAAAPTHVPTPSRLRNDRRKSEPSASVGALKVVLGGIAGLCIGQMILWWLPARLRTDPLELAPKLPAQLSFLAPAALRAPNAIVVENTEPIVVPEAEPPDEVTHSPAPIQVAPPSSNAASEVVLGLADAPTFRIIELRNSLRAAQAADRAFSRANEADSEAVSTWHEKLRELAYCVTFGDVSEPDINQFAQDTRLFLANIAVDSRKLKSISEIASATIDNAAHHRKGMLVAGEVKAINSAGHLFETKLAIPNSTKEVDVISMFDPREKKAYQIGDRVFVAGIVVTDPSLYLLGYEGSADAVVFGGLPVKY